MASITTSADGKRRIQFVGADNSRRTIYMGKAPAKTVEAVKLRVELIVSAQIGGHAFDDDTARWLAKAETKLAKKLAAAGLMPKRENALLGPFVDAYIASRTDARPRTIISLKQARKTLVEFYGERLPLRDITPGSADEWRLKMLGEGLAEATVRRRCGMAKQFVRAAIRKRLLAENPFQDLKSASQANDSRDYYVTRAESKAVLEACPNSQWKLLFALCRFGGLRCPSEPKALRWGDIDWEKGAMTINSPKTGTRIVPVFPELLPYLNAAWDEAGDDAEAIITLPKTTESNLRTNMHRIIRRAGLTPWPKTFQNLRATRETELVEQFPMHVVCDWIGNSQVVAMKHYLQVTADHFQKATQKTTQTAPVCDAPGLPAASAGAVK